MPSPPSETSIHQRHWPRVCLQPSWELVDICNFLHLALPYLTHDIATIWDARRRHAFYAFAVAVANYHTFLSEMPFHCYYNILNADTK